MEGTENYKGTYNWKEKDELIEMKNTKTEIKNLKEPQAPVGQ